MTDEEIVALYWNRDEAAIRETGTKYGAYCRRVAGNLLPSAEDAEECISDTWLRAWNAIPPQRPANLRAFLAKLTRNLAFDRWKAQGADKRGGGELPLVLDELAECVSGGADAESALLTKELGAAVNRFVRGLPARDAALFVGRYFYAEPVAALAQRCGMTPNHAAVRLSRVRRKLREYLEQEGLIEL